MDFSDLVKYLRTDNCQRIADRFGASRQVVWHWRRKNAVPRTWQRLIERMTRGKLKATTVVDADSISRRAPAATGE
jgi:hypothetical protein